MWRPERYFWQTPGRLPTVWQVKETRRVCRENVVCREAGATVTRNVKLRDMNVQVPAIVEREIEVVAGGFSIHTMRSAVWTSHRTDTRSWGQRGQVRRIGEGRWGTEALECMANMAFYRARDAPPVL